MPTQQRGRPGPALPYELLAGVVPCQKGWLVASGKLVGISLNPEPPSVVAHFAEVLDHIPAYTITAVFAPIGLGKKWTERGRTCDREARDLGAEPLGAGALDEAVLDEDVDVVGEQVRGEGQRGRELGGRGVALGQQVDDGEPAGVGQGTVQRGPPLDRPHPLSVH